jgi:hypothetical protein
MANELSTAVKSAAANIARYIADAATLTVETRFVEAGAQGFGDFDKALPAARTVIRLDGDSETIAPVRKTNAGVYEVDEALFELHQVNVETAIEYRARILSSLLEALNKGQ